MKKTERLTVALTTEQLTKIKEKAEKENRTVSDFIRLELIKALKL